MLVKTNKPMNIFVTDEDPYKSAIVLADSHIVKMGVEACQMLAIVASPWYHNYGQLYRKNGEPYKTKKGAHRNHPCTKWVAENPSNAIWLIHYGIALVSEFQIRYKKPHGSMSTLFQATKIFPWADHNEHTPFVRAMSDDLKNDQTIDTFTAYKKYLNTKPWVKNDYLKAPERKPDWIES